MRERSILFSGPMVRAILNGTKTQTRRVVKMPRTASPLAEFHHAGPVGEAIFTDGSVVYCPYGQPGDRLWLKETYRFHAVHDHVPPRELFSGPVWYEAQDAVPFHPSQFGKLRPSIFMPRWASRITLEVTDVRVERLQDISEADAMAEGAVYHNGFGVGHSGWRHDDGDVHENAKSAYARLWSEIHGPGSWGANPFCWVIEFRRTTNAG